ncbi:MAG: type II toxin-antitoxin system mRNA interferase toxin, RelE/StbE family [Candidatus Gracilibacteria bacterium]|jgi:addiction module RelE/StbE family toxin
MKIKNIYYSSHFAKAFGKLPVEIKKQAIEKEKLFRADCFDKKLKTHKLKGQLANYWTFSINHSYIILFEFTEDNSIGLIDIGTHSIY